MSEAKPFVISKWEVWKAYKRVKANQGAAGKSDDETIADFERNLKGNLYKIWNRMSSGGYFPPLGADGENTESKWWGKKTGHTNRVGSDRTNGGEVEAGADGGPAVPSSSCRYRPGKSGLDAVGQARKRCWRYDWILDLDIKGFFDNIPQDLLIRAVKKHAQERWMELYIERWLKAPVQEGRPVGPAWEGNAARRSDQPSVSQSVSALFV